MDKTKIRLTGDERFCTEGEARLRRVGLWDQRKFERLLKEKEDRKLVITLLLEELPEGGG